MSGLQIFIVLVVLFTFGSVCGWVIEVFFRRFFTAKKWINPGFMTGPYLPIYGFGTMCLYGISNIDLSMLGANSPWIPVIKVLIIGVGMTLIELIAGLIFIKGMNIKLWDYSNRWGNFKGIICPLFSFLWLAVGVIYYYGINPYLVQFLVYLSSNTLLYFFFGIILGAIIVDCCYSFHLATRITKVAKKSKIIISYEKLKESIKDKNAQATEKIKSGFLLAFKSNKTIEKMVEEYQNSRFYHKDKYYKDKSKTDDQLEK